MNQPKLTVETAIDTSGSKLRACADLYKQNFKTPFNMQISEYYIVIPLIDLPVIYPVLVKRYDKSLKTPQNSKLIPSKATTQKRNQMSNYTTIVDGLRTVSCVSTIIELMLFNGLKCTPPSYRLGSSCVIMGAIYIAFQ